MIGLNIKDLLVKNFWTLESRIMFFTFLFGKHFLHGARFEVQSLQIMYEIIKYIQIVEYI